MRISDWSSDVCSSDLKLSSALDSAGLAAASTVSTTNLETDARKYLDVNFQDYLGSEINDFQVTANSSKTVISLSATAELPTTLMNLFGFRTMRSEERRVGKEGVSR